MIYFGGGAAGGRVGEEFLAVPGRLPCEGAGGGDDDLREPAVD